MGDPQRELPVDSLLSCGGRQFVVRSSMTVLFEDAPLLYPGHPRPSGGELDGCHRRF